MFAQTRLLDDMGDKLTNTERCGGTETKGSIPPRQHRFDTVNDDGIRIIDWINPSITSRTAHTAFNAEVKLYLYCTICLSLCVGKKIGP